MLVIFSLRWHFPFLISILRYIFCTHIVVEISVNPTTLFHIENQNISNCPAFFIQAPSNLLIPKFREYGTRKIPVPSDFLPGIVLDCQLNGTYYGNSFRIFQNLSKEVSFTISPVSKVPELLAECTECTFGLRSLWCFCHCFVVNGNKELVNYFCYSFMFIHLNSSFSVVWTPIGPYIILKKI